MSISKDHSRNRSGLQFLRSRYLTRTKFLLADKRSGFLGSIQKARSVWSQHYPRWTIVATPAPTELSLDPYLPEVMFWPGHLWRDRALLMSHDRYAELPDPAMVQRAVIDWREVVDHICRRYWPERYFINPFERDIRHAASGIVSASLLYYSDTTVIPEGRISHLIPDFQIGPESLPYSPHGALVGPNAARTEGMLAYYQDLVEGIFEDNPDRLREITMAAYEAGWELDRRLYPDGPIPIDQRKWWWYVPILPGMSAEDLRRAEHDIERIARGLSGDTPIDDMIADLKQKEATHQQIADTLGIDISTVTRRLKAMREG